MMIWMTIAILAYAAVAGVALVRTCLEHSANRSRIREPGDSLGLALGVAACLIWPVAACLVIIAIQIDTLGKTGRRNYG